jgi:hypothetical protein
MPVKCIDAYKEGGVWGKWGLVVLIPLKYYKTRKYGTCLNISHNPKYPLQNNVTITKGHPPPTQWKKLGH